MIPKYVNEGKDNQDRTTDCEQPQYKEIRYSSIVQLYTILPCKSLSTIPVTELYSTSYSLTSTALFELYIIFNSLKVSENKANNECYPSNNTDQDKRNCQLEKRKIYMLNSIKKF